MSTDTDRPPAAAPAAAPDSLHDRVSSSEPVGDVALPFPPSLSKEAFSQDSTFSADAFLSANHRYAVLDDLHAELGALLALLDRELLDLVQSEYRDFIRLGHLIDGGLQLVEDIKIDLGRFRKGLARYREELAESEQHVGATASAHHQLAHIRYQAQLMLWLDRQLTHWGRQVEATASGNVTQALLGPLVSEYLVAEQLHQACVGASEQQPEFLTATLTPRKHTLDLEFHAVVDEHMRRVMARGDHNQVVDMLQLYALLGNQTHALRLVAHQKTVSG